jgi:hypothetical protein
MNAYQANVSWWVGVSREEFARLRREREVTLRDSRFGVGAVYAGLGDAVPRPRRADTEFAPRPRRQ